MSADALAGFHPVVARWFRERLGAPSPPQERGWPAIRSGQDTLIAAPTGSGKTLAAFLTCIDNLVQQGLAGDLTDETQVVYVSPLKALSNDVQKNLAQPLAEIRAALETEGLLAPEVRVVVRTGDTPSSQRTAMTRKPPHILVTTPESLYLLLTAEKGRDMLRSTRTVIVDEIHAIAGSKRGSHLALSLERLEALAAHRPLRIGLSATQKPIAEIARLLVGANGQDLSQPPQCAIIDQGYRREIDLGIELFPSPLAAVTSLEQMEEMYDRLAQLIEQERTTLIFVNTRRLAERMNFHLAKRVGEEHVTSHHGSLSKEQRLRAEQRLKAGELKALVATASLELGIDIGTVDLVCQIGTPRGIATLLQRVGRSGHTLGGLPRGRLFPLTRDDLVEAAALFMEIRRGNLDRIGIPEKPLDILAQQLVAAVAADEWNEDELFELCRRAYPYRDLTRAEYDAVVRMLSEGVATSRGRSAAYLHYDGVGQRLRARRGARLAAASSGGAIPDNADYQVVLEPENVMVGTVNEDWAIESMAGDIFQLGTSSWRILRVEQGKVRVEDAHGQPPTIPFWLGEAPARTDELSAAVSELRERIGALLPDTLQATRWVLDTTGIDEDAATQLIEYLAAGKQVLGTVPTQKTLVLERFFDDSGGMQLVVHSPFGSRVNRAWGLALRKRFCRTFNLELQAAATENAIVISLGPQHSFPLEEVFSYLHPNSAQEVLVQALLAAPMFQTRWRWNTNRALAVLRQMNGRRVPMPIQRMRSDDLLSAVFPDVNACQENVVGDIQLPDHPLVNQTVYDCLHEAMDIDGFLRLLTDVVGKQVELVARDTTEPSPLAHEILNARPYAFLDDAPIEERRTQAVSMRHTLRAGDQERLATLDPEAIQRVREQAWPAVESTDELHDALLVLNFLTVAEGAAWHGYFDELLAAKRATRINLPGAPQPLWAAAERLPLFAAAFPGMTVAPEVTVPAREQSQAWETEPALVEILRGRLEALGPQTSAALAAPLGLTASDIGASLAALEAEGAIIQGRFSPHADDIEWCDRRLLARIHRYTLDRLRQEIEPVSAADFMRFLMQWQHVDPDSKLDGPTGLVAVLEALEGFEVPAAAWEDSVLPARLAHYNPSMMEQLCLSGEVAWARLYPPTDNASQRAGATRMSPIALVFRDNLDAYLSLSPFSHTEEERLRGMAREIVDCLRNRGACFFQELVQRTRHLPSEVEEGLRELVSWGLVTCDGFTGLLSLTSPIRKQPLHRWRERDRGKIGPRLAQKPVAGRWSLLPRVSDDDIDTDARTEFLARQLLRRYGVVFPRLLLREPATPPWRDLVRVYRRLEARGEIRGGRFVAGFTGEQYAQPEAVHHLRAVRRKTPAGTILAVSGADPLNLVGIVTPGSRVPAQPGNRVVYRDGVPISVTVGSQTTALRTAEDLAPEAAAAG